ncbi:MAG: hypothetical protein U5L11_02520 [Arhodomonas sp.]|nr:hypothetical protein [Arhodomonas sp.]
MLILRDGAGNICWGLDGLTTTGHDLRVEQSFTGRIGLRWNAFATSDDGETTDTTAPEYRTTHMTLDLARLEVGGHLGPGQPSGSSRILIDDDSGDATAVVIHDTAASGADTGKPPVRLKLNSSAATIDVRDGSVGIATDQPGDVTTIGDINVQGGACFVGEGVTATNINVAAGTLRANLGAATLTQALIHDGTVTLDGDQVITTLQQTGGRTVCNVTGTIGTVELEGGTLDLSQSAEARTLTTVNLHRGATLIGDDDVVTINTLNEPDGPYTLAVS